MARSFSAVLSQSIEVASAPSINFGSGEYTVMAWVRFPAIPPSNSMIVGKRAGGFDGDEGWELKFANAAAGTVRWDHETNITGRQRAEADIPGLVDGNWHLIGGDHSDVASELNIWYDGAVVATKVTNTPGSVDTTTPMVIGAAYNTPFTNFLTGEVGPVFALSRLLTLAEHQSLAAGFSPRFLRPLPGFLMELISRASPEPDIVGGLTGTLNGAPDPTFNPRLILPTEPQPGQDLWYEFANATIVGQSSVAATGTRAHSVSATVAGQSNVSAVASVDVPVSATIAGQSSVTANISPETPLEAAISAQSNVTAAINIDAIVGAIPIEGQSNITASLSANVPVAAIIAAQSSIAADIAPAVPVDATIAGQSALTATGTRGRTVSVSIGGQSTLSADTTITAGAAAQVDAQSGLSAFLSATVPVATTIAAQSGIVADATALVPLATTIAAASGISATVTRGRTVDTTIAAQSALVAETRALVPLTATINANSGLTAAASADVKVSAAIAAQSDLSARLKFPGVKRTTSVGGLARWLFTVGGRIRR